MKKIILFLMISLVVPAVAGEWAQVDSRGVVKQVIVGKAAVILDRDDGPWINVGRKKVGIGWKYNGTTFSPPASTYAVGTSSGAAPGAHAPPKKGKARP